MAGDKGPSQNSYHHRGLLAPVCCWKLLPYNLLPCQCRNLLLFFIGMAMLCYLYLFSSMAIQPMNVVRMLSQIQNNKSNTGSSNSTRSVELITSKSNVANMSSIIKEGLLTIFTTFRPLDHKYIIHQNVIKNWGLFKPAVIPVLYNSSTDPRLTSLALEQGWDVHQVPRLNKHNLPFFKDMFLDAKSRYNTTFMGYCNGDILFQEGLVKTLKFLNVQFNASERVLVVGMRLNYFNRGRTHYTFDHVDTMAKKEARTFRPEAEDFFFMAHGDYPWDKVPGIVVGRSAYDNFIVAMAIQQNVSVVDASKTIIALHQTGRDGNTAGHFGEDSDWNLKVIGKFNYDFGHTTSAQFQTVWNKFGEIDLVNRQTKRVVNLHRAT